MGEIGLLPLFKLRLHGEPARKALEVRCVWIEALEGQRAEWWAEEKQAGGWRIHHRGADLCSSRDVRASRAGNPISTKYWIGRVLNIESRARSMACRREAGQGPTGREGAFVFVVGVLILRWAANSAESPAARLTRESSMSADPIPAGSESDVPSTAQSRDCSRLAKPKAQQVFVGIDHVTDTEGQRLSPHHYLVAYEGGQRTGLVFPPRVAELVGVVVAVHHVAEARVGRVEHTASCSHC